jgi:glycosyltransferase involved in cell wall biosynthesis
VRIAFIVQRYGTEILGGSEYHCRLVAERLAERHQVEVLTTCAKDYITWRNEYPEGADRIRGVLVRRFANAFQRDIASFNRYSDWIFHHPHDRADEMEWLRQQGPWCPALLEYVEKSHGSYDALIFFTCLYAPTALGVSVDPARSILAPTAHDEPALRLGIYREVFRQPAGIAYNTDVERAFLNERFEITAIAQETVGCGVDLPASAGDAARQDAARAERGDDEDERPGGEDETEGGGRHLARPHLSGRGAAFRRRRRLHGPIVLYGGRIEPGKGCEELLEYFHAFIESGGDATLALMGVKLMTIPESPHVRFAGLLSDIERAEALEAATVVVAPSPYESLSLLALEAMAVGTPVLANARSDVLVDHCRRSNAGLYYADRDEFAEALNVLLMDARLRTAMGRNGREYVKRNYRWDVILSKYERMIARIQGPRQPAAVVRGGDRRA